MNFILSLAHFCEVHGPTSIICTQLLAPRCESCYGTREDIESHSPNFPSTPSMGQGPPTSSGGVSGGGSTSGGTGSSSSGLPRAFSHPAMQSPTLAATNLLDTPPSSPIPPFITSSSLPNSITSTLLATHQPSDTCRNCALTLPKAIMDRLPPDAPPALRSREQIWLSPEFGLGHTHNLTYMSTHTPPQPSIASTLKRAALRALSCENPPNPSQPSAIFFGDPKSGYSITYTFRLLDPKARGGKRTYALLAICPDERRLLESWCFIVQAFQGLVKRIAQLANAASSTTRSKVSNSVGLGKTGGIEGFLRRGGGAMGEGRGLGELLGRDEIFVEVHAAFVSVINGLGKRFGVEDTWNEEEVGAGTSGRMEGKVEGEKEREKERERENERVVGSTEKERRLSSASLGRTPSNAGEMGGLGRVAGLAQGLGVAQRV